MEVLTTSINALAAVAAAAAALVAFFGLAAWRQQLRANVDFDAARRALLAAFRIRDAILVFRNPMHWMPEIVGSGATDLANYERDLYAKRWERVTAAGDELRSVELEGEVLWGREYLERLRLLTDCIRDLRFGLDDYLRRKKGAPGTDPMSPFLAEAQAIIKSKSTRDKPDAFETRVLEAIAGLEAFLRPRLVLHRR